MFDSYVLCGELCRHIGDCGSCDVSGWKVLIVVVVMLVAGEC